MHSFSPAQNLKIRYLKIGCIIMGCLIVTRLLYLQASIAYHLHTRGQKNFLRIIPVKPTRGNILDCKGRLLVTNRAVSNLCWVGSGKKSVTSADLKKLDKLADIVPISLSVSDELVATIKQAERKNGSVTLATDLTFEQLSQIEELFPDDAHIHILTSFKRLYPHETFACHTLGYLGHFDMSPEPIGRMGLEKICERKLRGQQGSTAKKINSFGKNLAEIELKRALSGHAIYTTLDIDIQKIAEAVFPENESGTIIVMDTKDGALQSVVSRPSFNPSLFLDHIDHEKWHKMQENRPFLNRAFNACYPPGSLFKLVTVSAALEHNIIKQDALWYCNGYFTYHGRRYGCHLHTGHGELSTCQALAHSCNILFYTIGKQIDIDLLAHYAHIFGLGTKTNVPFAEKEGLIPSRAWKRQAKGERWWQGETLSASIGQSFLLVTPIQVARMIASIFTGYLVQPRLLIKDPIISTPLRVRPETIDFLQRSMKSVVTGGTGQRINTVKNITIHGKTSTAQTSLLQKRDKGKEYMEHAWFVAHVQYKTERPFVIVVFIENCGSSTVATQTVKDFLQQYKILINDRATEKTSDDLAQEIPLAYQWTDATTQILTADIPNINALSQDMAEEITGVQTLLLDAGQDLLNINSALIDTEQAENKKDTSSNDMQPCNKKDSGDRTNNIGTTQIDEYTPDYTSLNAEHTGDSTQTLKKKRNKKSWWGRTATEQDANANEVLESCSVPNDTSLHYQTETVTQ